MASPNRSTGCALRCGVCLERMAKLGVFGPDGTHITTKPGADFAHIFATGWRPNVPRSRLSRGSPVLRRVRWRPRRLAAKLDQSGDEIERNVTDEELVLAHASVRNDAFGPDGDYSFACGPPKARQLCCARD